ncbi:hypothetical protein [Parasedimentitalea huanghaiensis]|uniref:Uncharacterized protein n=1 Tax=Parasedimentitalea huanghaiensis TaxID=2682100 RepID=A0A6L6WHJ8_9RHOB|nr:hypothetical protein [Zongyanglinia huanghaiensis]MVO17184.1 hypothetical protein [Zongyanglinia huanghaiensis]
MVQYYQPECDALIQAPNVETSDAEIMNEIRKVMLAEKVEHPDVVETQSRNEKPRPQATAPKPSVLAGALTKVKQYQPRWSHNLLILSLAAIIFSPLGVAAVVTLSLVAVLALVWSVGPSRLARAGRACFGLYYRFLPAQADRMVSWANWFSDRLQGLSSHLPSRWTQGLYLPTFSSEPDEDLDLVEPFDRLLAQRQESDLATAK